MRILLLSSAYNSLTQLAHVELLARDHQVGIAVATTSEAMQWQVNQFHPELILCPMLAQVIPRSIWEKIPCLILHPGIIGDRGASSLDWAILNEEKHWGVTVVEAADEVDSGAIWASYGFAMREAGKSSLYRDEVADAALKAMLLAVERFTRGLYVPQTLDYAKPEVKGRFRPPMKQAVREIDWSSDSVAHIVRKIRSADGHPGVLDEIDGQPVYLYGAHAEGQLIGKPGEIIATRHGAICRAAVDGAVWITHLKRKGSADQGYFKLPADLVLGAYLADIPEVPIAIDAPSISPTFRDIWYEEVGDVGTVHFDFYNGAMGTDQCRRLAEAVQFARRRPTRVMLLQGGRDFWSNGIHLNLIEAADDPAQASWENINAMNDLVHAILTATDHLTIAALYGSAGAGGVMLALAADWVVARDGLVLNPHYKGMGGLYGSEYWTYSLPRRVGQDMARKLTEECRPLGIRAALGMGLVDEVVVHDDCATSRYLGFQSQLARIAERFAHCSDYQNLLGSKRAELETVARVKPLAEYRAAELAEMRRNFWGDDPSYHLARAAFVRKQPRPAHLPCFVATKSPAANEPIPFPLPASQLPERGLVAARS